jgi:hypothetical protein
MVRRAYNAAVQLGCLPLTCGRAHVRGTPLLYLTFHISPEALLIYESATGKREDCRQKLSLQRDPVTLNLTHFVSRPYFKV